LAMSMPMIVDFIWILLFKWIYHFDNSPRQSFCFIDEVGREASIPSDFVSILMGCGSMFLAFHSLKATVEPNAFQVEEQSIVNQINTLLKQRRVE
ncbi:hypothetical protein, partial [Janthinobacterium sp.]|uniref:hypothetical protein n=1 Tax=Janthinobacterium sp. TaxID=1871054 RepID=UPI002603E50F